MTRGRVGESSHRGEGCAIRRHRRASVSEQGHVHVGHELAERVDDWAQIANPSVISYSDHNT